LNLYANVCVVRNIPGVETRHSHLNLNTILIRENTEGAYSGIESSPVPGVVESFKVITREASERIAKFAFDFCVKYGRKKVTVVHKANIM
jgi:isocitrate dehydrogenase (NAD+)